MCFNGNVWPIDTRLGVTKQEADVEVGLLRDYWTNCLRGDTTSY